MKFRVWCKNKNEYEKDQCFLAEDGRLFQLGAYGNMQPLSLDTHVIEPCLMIKERSRYVNKQRYIYIGDVVRLYGGECYLGVYEHDIKLHVNDQQEMYTYEFVFGESEFVEIVGNRNIYEKENQDE